ncbi:MAG: hypothetical protein COA44_00175 [Arcobacter sp.]|nr:MAG: hypothetical protein COA44_00175 [Arcobacter sp.]
MKKRYFELDFLRGFGIILMIAFHFGYDLSYFGYTNYQTTVDIQWKVFRSVVLSIFLLVVGMSSYLAFSKSINWKKVFKRSMKLFFISLLISLGSYSVFENSWIYFGVIHFILVAGLVSLIFVRLPNFSLLLGLAFLLSYNLGYFHLDAFLSFAQSNLGIPPHTQDVVSFTPWFGLVLIGIFLMHHKLFSFRVRETKTTQGISFLGKHALIIYLVHQPILFGAFNALAWVSN